MQGWETGSGISCHIKPSKPSNVIYQHWPKNKSLSFTDLSVKHHLPTLCIVICAIWYIVFLAHYMYVLLIVFTVLLSLFSSFDSLHVWSCIGWEMDQLEENRRKRVWFGVFRAEQSSGAAWVPAPATEI